MDARMFPRVGAIVLLAGTVLACAVELAHRDLESERSASSTRSTSEIDGPLAVELARCKALGSEAANDAVCKAAWAKSPERFFAPGTPYQGHAIDPFPATPDAPIPKAPAKIYLDRAPPAARPNAGSTPDTDPEGR
jgi:conjugative transfer region protein TrbK